jgi:hypothetical protein
MWLLKSCLMLGLVIMFPFLVACASDIAVKDDTVIPPKIWQIKQTTEGAECMNITGEYQLWGETTPQWPSIFKGLPFSLDIILGIDLPRQDRFKIAGVRIIQKGNDDITLTFLTQNGSLIQRKISPLKKEIICESDRVVITEKSVETTGEATRGIADIVDTLFIAQDGSLIVNTVIKGVNKSLITFNRKYREEYWAKFKAIEKR